MLPESLVGTSELKDSISKKPALLSFINDHLDYANIKTLRSLTGVKRYLDKTQVILSTIRRALECFDEENTERTDDKKKKKKKSTNKYSETVDKLKELREMGDPFAELKAGELREACARLRSLLAALRRRDQELENRQRSVKKWRKACDVACTAGIVAVLACSVILAAVAAPAAAIAGTTAFATATKAVEPWIESLWDGWEGPLREEKDLIGAMRKMGWLVLQELENARLTVDKLKIDINAILVGVGFAISEEEIEVKIGIFEHIMPKKGNVEKGIDGLKEKLDSCNEKIRKAATEFLKMIMKDI
ncbi:UPF0496 protein [Cocos nucifera]|uniref:UPF0496 protein n=1 Tax=Cocos nucifera TaxID=13894 RepID=A0A8K0J0R8_COCNU|nr:UPF0496 protein [Cocos nucifera]